MSSLRIFWIVWCTMWALCWFVVGLYTFGLGWLMILPTLLAILIPIGRESRPTTVYVLPGYVPPGYGPYPQPWQGQQPYPGWAQPQAGAPWAQLPPPGPQARPPGYPELPPTREQGY